MFERQARFCFLKSCCVMYRIIVIPSTIFYYTMCIVYHLVLCPYQLLHSLRAIRTDITKVIIQFSKYVHPKRLIRTYNPKVSANVTPQKTSEIMHQTSLILKIGKFILAIRWLVILPFLGKSESKCLWEKDSLPSIQTW